jgi:NADH-quinone oxidoreductase subunit M
MSYALLLLILIPAVGAIVCALWPKGGAAKTIALVFSVITLLQGICLAWRFDWAGGKEMLFGFSAKNPFYMESIGFGLKLGIDAISLWLVLLTVLLQPLAILASFQSIKERPKEYYAWMLALLAAMNGVFVARDLLLFYIFFELTLVPMFFIIGIWGGPQRRYAAGKFFLFTFSGSVFTLAGIIYLGLMSPHGFDLNHAVQFAQKQLSGNARWWLLLAFLAGFAVKVPLFPVHTWLPLAHTEAPTAGSVILAGVLLKLGTYGLLKLAVPTAAPDAVAKIAPYIAALCVVGVIYGALVAWVQQDIKKLVAYSSVSHLGFCVLGLFALNVIGVQGSVLYMINHGLSTGALFLCVGMIYDRYHTRDINQLSGLARQMPRWAFFMILFTLSSIGLPGTNGFFSEFLTILGAFTSSHLGIAYGSLAALGIILGAIYMLHMAARVVWGPLKAFHNPNHTPHAGAERSAAPDELPTDLNGRELTCLIPIAVCVIVLGWFPNLILKTTEQPAQAITQAIPPASTPTLAAR